MRLTRPLALASSVLAALAVAPAGANTPPHTVAEIASTTFVLGCAAHVGMLDKLHQRLQPGGDLYLPRLPDDKAKPFLQGRPGEAYIREEAGVTIALLTKDDQCAVFVRRVAGDALHAQLVKDLTVSVGRYFTVNASGGERKGALQARFIDLLPTPVYRDELAQRHGGKPTGLRVILTTSESANPNLQAIITIGVKVP
jgi:hypothetical protein